MTASRAALVTEIGTTPVVEPRDRPVAGASEVVLDVLAVSFNPVDVAIATGRFYAGHPPLPYVPGIEAVGRPVGEERLVYAQGGGLGIARDGFAAEQVAVPRDALIDLPVGSDPAIAAALGTAGLAGWMAVTQRGEAVPGDIVVVLGATGTVGRVALQAARASQAARVVAVGRSTERLAAVAGLADATVPLDGDDLAGRIVAACGEAPTLVIDGLWGPPAVAAMVAAAPRARFVHLGASAGPEATVPSAVLRGKQLDVRGYSNFGLPRPVFEAAYRELVERADAGQITIDVERVPLDAVADAWEAAATGRSKAVVCPVPDAAGGAT